MTSPSIAFTGGPIFDGETLHQDKAALFDDVFAGLVSADESANADLVIDLNGDILSPGYVDLQVNGGGGVMFNDDPCAETLLQIAQAHRSLGTVRLLPTLITDSRAKTKAAINAAQTAIAAQTPGIAGLHLEGPHLSVARKGAHDAKYIRPMDADDLQNLITAKANLPFLKVTIAPENVTPAQVTALAEAGICVSLGHTDADFDTCMTYAKAGASCVTHLFNAMRQLNSRAPGLVGAALECGNLSAGLIADSIHVHPASMRTAWAAKMGPGRIFLVSDAMAVAGTDLTSFHLDGREITRRDGQLRLSDGTLAGADLTLTKAIWVLVNQVGASVEHALAAATIVPATLCGLPHSLTVGRTKTADMIRISADLMQAEPLHP